MKCYILFTEYCCSAKSQKKMGEHLSKMAALLFMSRATKPCLKGSSIAYILCKNIYLIVSQARTYKKIINFGTVNRRHSLDNAIWSPEGSHRAAKYAVSKIP